MPRPVAFLVALVLLVFIVILAKERFERKDRPAVPGAAYVAT